MRVTFRLESSFLVPAPAHSHARPPGPRCSSAGEAEERAPAAAPPPAPGFGGCALKEPLSGDLHPRLGGKTGGNETPHFAGLEGSTMKSPPDLVRVLRQLRIPNGVPQPPPLSCLFFSFLGLAFFFFSRAARSCSLTRKACALGQTRVPVLIHHLPSQTHILLFKKTSTLQWLGAEHKLLRRGSK